MCLWIEFTCMQSAHAGGALEEQKDCDSEPVKSLSCLD